MIVTDDATQVLIGLLGLIGLIAMIWLGIGIVQYVRRRF